MLKSVIEQLAEQDTQYIAPKRVRTNLRKGLQLFEGYIPPTLSSTVLKAIARKPLPKSTIKRLHEQLLRMESELGDEKNKKHKGKWLLLGGFAGKRWMTTILE